MPLFAQSHHKEEISLALEVATVVRFQNGASLERHGRTLTVYSPGAESRRLQACLDVQPDRISLCQGPWNHVMTLDGRHQLSRVTTDFARGVALKLSVLTQGGAVLEASEQYINGSRARRAYDIGCAIVENRLVLWTSTGEVVMTPLLPLDWKLARA